MYVIKQMFLCSFQILRITCETRKGPLDFVTTIRQALAKHFGDKIIGKY